MATIPGRVEVFPGGSAVISWGPLANGDDGAPQLLGAYRVTSVQVFDTLGAGGAVQLRGSLASAVPQAAEWAPLGANLTALGVSAVTTQALWISPLIAGGDGTTSLRVRVLLTADPRASG